MKICCIADIHCNLIDIPDADILLIGGDIVNKFQFRTVGETICWMEEKFRPWINSISKRMPVVAVAGNHDELFQQNSILVPKMKWTYLEDSGEMINGLKIWGSPWQKQFGNMAFNADEKTLRRKWNMIPNRLDVLLLHGPPKGILDDVRGNPEGSESLYEAIVEKKPKVCVFGHIHSSRGYAKIGDTLFVNAAITDGFYRVKNKPFIFDI